MNAKEQKLAQVDELIKNLGLTKEETFNYLAEKSSVENNHLKEEQKSKKSDDSDETEKKFEFYDKLHMKLLKISGVLLYGFFMSAIVLSVLNYYKIFSDTILLHYLIIYGTVFAMTLITLVAVVVVKSRYDYTGWDFYP